MDRQPNRLRIVGAVLGAWWLTGRWPWPRRLDARFLAVHLGAALSYGVLWIVMGLAVGTIRTGENVFANPGGGWVAALSHSWRS